MARRLKDGAVDAAPTEEMERLVESPLWDTAFVLAAQPAEPVTKPKATRRAARPKGVDARRRG